MTDSIRVRSYGVPHPLDEWNDAAHTRRLRRLSGAKGRGGLAGGLSLPGLKELSAHPVAVAAGGAIIAALFLASVPLAFPCGIGSHCRVTETLDHILENPAILGANGRILGYGSDRWGPAVRRDQAPMCLDALRYKEDRGLYTRWTGFDPKGIVRAARDNTLATRVVSGASTYEQQIARTVFRLAWGGVAKKLAEISVASWMRLWYSAPEIESLYAATIYMGRGVHGLEPAARAYFGKPLPRLDAGECALLSVLPAAPARRDPETHYAGADSARRFGLARMVEAGLITDAVMRSELSKPIAYRPAAAQASAPLLRRLRAETASCRMEVGPIRTTVDGSLQELLMAEATRLRDTGVLFDGVAIRPSGAVLAWVGNPETPAEIASQLKPFEAGIGDDSGIVPLRTVVASLPWPTGGPDIVRWLTKQRQGCFDVGIVSDALGPSENCTFLRVHTALARAGGLHRLRAFGLPTVSPAPAAALGLVEVPLTTLAAAYSAFLGNGQIGGVSAIPGCGPAPLPAPISSQTAAQIYRALQETLSGNGTMAWAASRYWGSRQLSPAAKTGTSERVHGVVVMTHDVVLALRLRSEHPLRGAAGRSVGPAAMRILRGWYD